MFSILGQHALFRTSLLLLLAGCVLAGLLNAPAKAQEPHSGPKQANWITSIPDTPASPAFFLAVDKDAQRFYALERHSPLQVVTELPCTTGQVPGDKLKQDDKRTPEGVYFVQAKRTHGLDYARYGDMAFTLNFPNPVDRIKGKTGYGIWIHGRGSQIVPRETRGCVALNNPDLREMDTRLQPGTPVLIARQISWPIQQYAEDHEKAGAAGLGQQAQHVAALTREWARAWQARDEAYFDFYDPERFAKAERESFGSFRRGKERLFSRNRWIGVMVRDVSALPGPDYWVTSFGQIYMAQGMYNETTKRLYWQQDQDGEWRIVGREYAPPPDGLAEACLNDVKPQVHGLLEQWRQAWTVGDLEAYGSLYLQSANQQGRRGARAIVRHKERLWRADPPADVRLGQPDMRLTSRGLVVQFSQEYSSASGYSDVGHKVLRLVPVGPNANDWRIAEERWSAKSS